MLAESGQQITFNMFSAPVGYDGPLRHTPQSLAQTGEMMAEPAGRLSPVRAFLRL